MIKNRNNSGFTMIELLVVLAVSSIVLTLMYKVYHSQLKTHTTQQAYVESQQNLRAAMYLIERDIRMAGFDPLNSNLFGITEDGTNSITVTMDLNESGTLAPATEQIRYVFDSVNLERNGQILIPDIDDVEFVYYNENGGETGTLDLIRSVRIRLEDSFPTTAMVAGDNKELILESDVRCRNLVN